MKRWLVLFVLALTIPTSADPPNGMFLIPIGQRKPGTSTMASCLMATSAFTA